MAFASLYSGVCTRCGKLYAPGTIIKGCKQGKRGKVWIHAKCQKRAPAPGTVNVMPDVSSDDHWRVASYHRGKKRKQKATFVS